MQLRAVGTSGLRVSRMGLGTMNWGGETDAEEAANTLVTFVDAGGTLVDTAAAYEEGLAEEILGSLLADLVPREELVVATKAGAAGADGGAAGRGALLGSLHGSLRRLGTDYLDLWQLPAWDASVPIEETLSAVDAAVRAGKVRYAGVCGYTGWQLATAAQRQRLNDSGAPLVSAQLEYSLLDRGAEGEPLAAAGHHGIGLLAWAPLGRGVLTGKYRDRTPADSRGACPRYAGYVDRHRTERAGRIVQAVTTAADGLGTSPLAVALAWVRDRPGVAAPVVGARDAQQLHGSLRAEEITLPEEIRAALDDISAGELAAE